MDAELKIRQSKFGFDMMGGKESPRYQKQHEELLIHHKQFLEMHLRECASGIFTLVNSFGFLPGDNAFWRLEDLKDAAKACEFCIWFAKSFGLISASRNGNQTDSDFAMFIEVYCPVFIKDMNEIIYLLRLVNDELQHSRKVILENVFPAGLAQLIASY